MKTKELMIGDLVEFGGDPLKVQYIYNNGFDDIIADRVVEYIDYDDGPYERTEDIQLEYCSPIPLTKEILKANGLKFDDFKDEFRLYNRIDVDNVWSIQAFKTKAGWYFDITSSHRYHSNSSHMRIKYVHELQHALRLCGITELADNFKIVK